MYDKRKKDSFIDVTFPPNGNSLMGKSKEGSILDPLETRRKLFNISDAEWKRIADIISKPVIFEDTLKMFHIKHGRISLPYFYSVLSSLSIHYPSIFTKIILTKDYDEKGLYQVNLFVDGEYSSIIIDDYFPCIQGTNVCFFTRPSNFQIWPLLIEKAWAKVNGGYLNIVNLWPGDLFKGLTGFPFDQLIHPQITKEELFDELYKLYHLKKNKGLAFSLTSNNKEVEKKGLFIYHMYNIEEVEKVEVDKDKYIYLLKLRDSEDESNWLGDYNPQSNLWTDKIKSKIDENKLSLKNGEFWISLEDFHKYFIRTDACHMLTDGFISKHNFQKDQLKTPKVFNLYVLEDGIISISIFEKNWRFHRELRNISHPTSLIIAEYDPSNKSIKNVYSNYENNDDLEITKTLKKGLYIVWAYKTTDPNEKLEVEEMSVRFCTLTKASASLMGDDENFELVRNLIYQYVKDKNKDQIKNDDFYYTVDNSFDKSGIGYQMVINPLDKIYQIWKVDSRSTHGFMILPPHEKQEFELTVGFKDYQNILGIKRYKYGKHCLNLGVDVTIMRGTQKPPKVDPKPNLDKFFSKDGNKLKIIFGEKTFASAELKKSEKFKKLNHWDIFLEKLKFKYTFIAEELKKLKPLTEEKFDINIIERNGNIYIGETDYGIRFGRGAFIFGAEETTYIGYWDKGLQFVKGKVFDKDNKIIFEGEYKDGLRNGNGVYNYSGGEKYDGKFANGLRDGKGIFNWKNGLKWDGFFKKDEFDGEGTFTDEKGSLKATFKDGDLVEK